MHAPYRDDDPTGHLVVLGSGPQAEWKHAMQRLAAVGPLLLIDTEPPTWQRPYLAAARTANLLEPAQVIDVVAESAGTQPIAGVLTSHPAYARTAALLRRAFQYGAGAFDVFRQQFVAEGFAEVHGP